MSLAQQWQHLAAWWVHNGHRYNVSALARAVGRDKSALSVLLRDPTSPKYAATAELLASLTAELAHAYAPLPAPTPTV